MLGTMPSERVQRRIDSFLDRADEALESEDWQRSLELAEAALGLDDDNPNAQSFFESARLGASHICFNVDDLDQTHADLSNKGIRFVTEPKYRPTDDGGRHGLVHAQDPEGNWLEFTGS